jgi:divalent metal cation (Fe/Co/Zn/Cd) transporter
MIGIKSFHLFFISMSILLSGWYGYFEIMTPSNPGSLSTSLSIISFMVMFGLGFYGYSVFKKFREI